MKANFLVSVTKLPVEKYHLMGRNPGFNLVSGKCLYLTILQSDVMNITVYLGKEQQCFSAIA